MCVALQKKIVCEFKLNSTWPSSMIFKNLNELFWQLCITERSWSVFTVKFKKHDMCYVFRSMFSLCDIFISISQILHICMQSVLNSNILPWRLYCSKWQVLCILLLIKQQILKYCCARLVPDFLYKWNAQQHAQHLEEFAISCEYPVFAFISLRFRECFNTCSTNNIRLLRREGDGVLFQN